MVDEIVWRFFVFVFVSFDLVFLFEINFVWEVLVFLVVIVKCIILFIMFCDRMGIVVIIVLVYVSLIMGVMLFFESGVYIVMWDGKVIEVFFFELVCMFGIGDKLWEDSFKLLG